MDLFFVTEARFIRRGDNVYCIDNSMTNKLWERYLSVFDHIQVVARVSLDIESQIDEANLASNKRVSFVDLPYYVGLGQYLKVRSQIRKVLSIVLVKGNVYICRVPGIIGGLAVSFFRKRKIPYGIEVVGDPWDVFAPGFKHPLRILLRYNGYWGLRKIVKNAAAVLYVTKWQLQKRYPVSPEVYAVSVSDVMVSNKEVPSHAHILNKKERYELISVGSLAQMYKAPDVVIRALAVLKKNGVDVHVTWLGDGVYKERMQEYAKQLDVSEWITFIGTVQAEVVREYLQKSDIFLLVSRTEGLPRALVEAMTEGLPCIATRVGGIPELLDDEMMIPKDNPEALAEKIEYLVRNLDVANLQAKRNYENGKEYYDDVLRNRRCCFYNYLVDYIR